MPARLALVALLFAVAVATVHFLSFDRLLHVDAISSEVRNRWLDSIRILSDLNDRVSDLRAAEGELLLSRDSEGRDKHSAELQQLVGAAAQAINKYKGVPHDADELLILRATLGRARRSCSPSHVISPERAGRGGRLLSPFFSHRSCSRPINLSDVAG